MLRSLIWASGCILLVACSQDTQLLCPQGNCQADAGSADAAETPPDGAVLDTGAQDSGTMDAVVVSGETETRVIFPSDGALTNQDQITIRGLGDSATVGIWLNGQAVQTTDNYQHWSLRVALDTAQLATQMRLEEDRGEGRYLVSEFSVQRNPGLLDKLVAGVASGNGKVSLLGPKRLVEVGLNPAENRLVATPRVPGNPVLTQLARIEDNYFVTAVQTGVLQISSDGAVSNPIRSDAYFSDLAARNNQLYAFTFRPRRALVRARIPSRLETISDSTRGSGPAFGATNSMTLSGDGQTAYTIKLDTQQIFRIDLRSGNREPINYSADERSRAFSLVLSPDEKTAYIAHRNPVIHDIAAVDLQSGALRTISSGRDQSLGPVPSGLVRLAEGPGDTIYAISAQNHLVLAIDTITGKRTSLLNEQVGSGRKLDRARGLSIPLGPEGHIYSVNRDGLVKIDPRNGDRLLPQPKSLPTLNTTALLQLSPSELFISTHRALLRYRPQSNTHAEQAAFDKLIGVGDLGEGRLLLLDAGKDSFMVRNSDGTIETLHGPHSRIPLTEASNFCLTPDRGTAFVVQWAGNGPSEVVQVDLNTGKRAVFPSAGSIRTHQIFCGEQGFFVYQSSTSELLLYPYGGDQAPMVIASEDVGKGAPLPGAMGGFSLRDEEILLMVAGTERSSIMALDLKTKERVYLSR